MILKSSHQKRQRLLNSGLPTLPVNRIRSTRGDTAVDPAGFGPVRLNDLPENQASGLDVYFPNGVHLSIKGQANMKEIIELINRGE